MEIEGRCHCGNLSFLLRTTRPFEKCRMGECDCSFCVAHGSKGIADSLGRATITIRNESDTTRYRFGMKTALVRTGKFRPPALERTDVVPDVVVSSLADFPAWLGRVP